MEAWRVADEGLVRVTRARRAMDAEQMQWLLEARRTGADRELGFASFKVYEQVRMAEALEGLPALHQELSSLQLGFCAVRELTRVCVAATEGVWIEAARGQTVRDVEKLVSGHVPGDFPDDPVDPAKRRCRLVLDVNPAELALFKEMRRTIEADAGHRLEDGALVVELASGASPPRSAIPARRATRSPSRSVNAASRRLRTARVRWSRLIPRRSSRRCATDAAPIAPAG